MTSIVDCARVEVDGIQPYGLGFRHSQRPGAVLALPVTDRLSLVLTCIRV